jgi:signal transduction histidine kinase
MNSTEAALKERIKELTCLYEVSSIIVNTDLEQVSETLCAIGLSLKKAFQHKAATHISIKTPLGNDFTKKIHNDLNIISSVTVFNKIAGSITAYLSNPNYGFLAEEQQLMDSVALKLGNLLERLEIQRNETSLKRQMEHADRLNILGELTAGIAHELNTPLANILGFAELLEQDNFISETAKNDIDKIIKNAIFSREVVKKLMFFACEMPQEMKAIDMVQSIKGAVNLLEAIFRKEHISYRLLLPEEPLLVNADSIQFTQIIFNLVINAIYFTAPDTTITINAFEEKNFVFLKIIDQGPGITTTASEKLFQPFFSTKPTGDGAGLGLSVVHGIVSSHQGTITATNNVAGGATFTVKLPKR